MNKLLKILGWTVGIIVVLLVIAVVALELFFPAEKARQMIVEKASAAMGRPVNVGSVDFSIWGGLGVTLDSVVVDNPPDWPADQKMLTADKVDVKVRILPLISGEYRLSKLIIDRPVINLTKTETGANNFTFPATDTSAMTRQMPEETRSAALAVSLDELRINSGQVTYVDDSSDMSIALNLMNLTTSLDNPQPGQFKSEGRLEVDRVIAVTEDTIKPVTLALRYDVDYDMNRKHVLLHEADLRINQLNFNATGELDHSGPAMTARGNVRSNQIAVRDLFSLMPPAQMTLLDGYTIEGDFTLNADIQYDGALEDALNYSGNADIKNMLLEYQKVPGQLRIASALIDFKRDNVRFNIQDGSFNDKPLKGYVYVENFDAPRVNGELAGEINLALVRPFLPAETNPELSGDAAFAIKAVGPVKQVDSLDLSGTLKVTNGRYASSKLPEPVESFTVDMFFDKRLVRVNTFTAQMPSGNVAFSGRINDLLPYIMADSTEPVNVHPEVDGTVEGSLNLAMLNPFLPEEGNPKLAGMMNMNLALAGDVIEPSGLRIRGNLAVDNGSYFDTTLAEPVERFDARLTVVPDTIRIDQFAAKFTTSDMNLTGSLIRPFPYLLPLKSVDRENMEKPFLQFQMTSHRFNVDSMFPEVSPTTAEPGSGVADTIAPFILPDINGRGTATFDTVVYMDVDFTNLNGNIVIRDRKVVVTDVVGKVYTGDIKGETSIDLNDWENPVYDGRFAATNIEANDFASRFTKFDGLVYGKLNMDGTFNAAGWEPDALLNTLTMSSDALMREGKIQTGGAIRDGLQALAKLVDDEIDVTQELRNARTKITVEDGRVKFDKLQSQLGQLGDVEVTGSYGFDGTLDYTGTILLSEKQTADVLSGNVVGDITSFLGGGKSVKRIGLPLKIGGTITNPTFTIDYNAIADQAGKGALDAISGKLKGLIPQK